MGIGTNTVSCSVCFRYKKNICRRGSSTDSLAVWQFGGFVGGGFGTLGKFLFLTKGITIMMDGSAVRSTVGLQKKKTHVRKV